MESVRYTQRICSDQQQIEAFLLSSRIGILALRGESFPYAVPVNYIWYKDAIYFHGMGSGKKNALLAQNPPVCFTIYAEHGTVIDPVPCHADTAYMSVMIFGKAEKLIDFAESAVIMQKMLDKYMPNYYSQPLTGNLMEKYKSSLDGNGVGIYRIQADIVTAKENAVNPRNVF